MKITAEKISAWHKTRAGMLIFGLIELALVYIWASLAINSGAWWQWLIVIILLFGAISNLIGATKAHKK